MIFVDFNIRPVFLIMNHRIEFQFSILMKNPEGKGMGLTGINVLTDPFFEELLRF